MAVGSGRPGARIRNGKRLGGKEPTMSDEEVRKIVRLLPGITVYQMQEWFNTNLYVRDVPGLYTDNGHDLYLMEELQDRATVNLSTRDDLPYHCVLGTFA